MIEIQKYDDWVDVLVNGEVVIGNHSIRPEELIQSLIDKGVIDDTLLVTEKP